MVDKTEFVPLPDARDPTDIAVSCDKCGVDELVLFDITAPHKKWGDGDFSIRHGSGYHINWI